MNTHDLYTLLISSPILALIALALERWLPWPEQWHPLPMFRLFAQYLQTKVNKPGYSPEQQRFAGAMAVVMLLFISLVPTAIVVYAADFSEILGALVLLACLRRQHYLKLLNKVDALALKQQKRAARALLARIDYRDTDQLSVHGLVKATAELRAVSIIHHRWAPILAWLLGGPILALALRLISELYTLWPISVSRYRTFGLPARAAYVLLIGPVTLLLSVTALLIAAVSNARPAEPIKNSRALVWPTGKWLDSLSRCHDIALGGPIKVQGTRIERQRFAGRAPEQHNAQFRRAIARWHGYLILLLIVAVLLLFIYRP